MTHTCSDKSNFLSKSSMAPNKPTNFVVQSKQVPMVPTKNYKVSSNSISLSG